MIAAAVLVPVAARMNRWRRIDPTEPHASERDEKTADFTGTRLESLTSSTAWYFHRPTPLAYPLDCSARSSTTVWTPNNARL